MKLTTSVESWTELVSLAPHITVPPRFTASGELDGNRIEMVLEVRGGSVECVSITVDAGPTYSVGEAMRRIPVSHLVKQATRQVIVTEHRDEVSGTAWGGSHDRMPDQVRAEWPRGDTDEVLRWVADCYRLAASLGDPPTVAVMEATGWSRPTANRALKLARDTGFLGADEGRGAFGGARPRLHVEEGD